MTRETKVGLVVACSFLCLVGVVVASKLRGANGTTADAEQQEIKVAAAKANPDTEKNNVSPTPPKSAKDSVVISPTPKPEEKKPSDAFPPLGSINAADIRFEIPPQPKQLEPKKESIDVELERLRNQALLAQNTQPLTPTPLPIPPTEPKGNALSFPSIEPKNPTPIGTPPVEPKGSGITFPPIGGKDGPPTIQPPNTLDPKIIAPNPIAIDGDKNQGIVGQIGSVQLVPIKPLEEKKDGLVFPPITNKPDNTPPIASITTPLGDPGKKPFAIEPPPTVPPFTDNTAPPMVTPLKNPPRVITDTIPVAPPFNLTPKGPNPTIPSGQTNLLDLPSTPSIGTAPITIGSKPILKETQPDSYFARTGETSFSALSTRIYNDERYASALLAYNRRHREIIRNGENFAFDPPIVREGQEVLYPNRGILERDFGNLIPGLGGVTPTTPSGNSGINIAKPEPIVVPNISAVSNPPVPPSGRTYVVQNPNGESILDIAERALGSRSRWTDIYNLNAGVQPQFRIPAGTQLKLP
ncbi:MAG: hypothetical protein EXS16_09290 [Gemmataceae bacterium]|nr:hypothetical protein [Gemmataceae bacterium]